MRRLIRSTLVIVGLGYLIWNLFLIAQGSPPTNVEQFTTFCLVLLIPAIWVIPALIEKWR